MRKSLFIILLTVFFGLLIPAELVIADELDIVIRGIEEPALSNVRKLV